MIDPGLPPPVLGPIRVTGGPRAGKTGLLARLAAAWLVDGGEPDRVVVVTRSHPALTAMEERIGALLPSCHTPPRLLTQEGLARAVLRDLGEPSRRAVALGRLGEWAAMREALRTARPLLRWLEPLADDPGCVDDLLEFVSLVKQSLVGPGLLAGRLRDERGLLPELALVAGRYQEALARLDARDTRDLTKDAVSRLEHDPSQLRGWADLLLVDEAEDLTPSQWRLISLLGRRLAAPGRLVMAGDGRVAVPSFRGPTATFFEESFPREFQPVEWRLGDRAAAWACASLARIGLRDGVAGPGSAHDPMADASSAPSPGVEIWSARDEIAESLAIAREIRRAHLALGLDYQDVAVLLWDPVRQLGPLRAAMAEAGVPIRVDRHRWSDSVVVRVVLGWLSALVNPADDATLIECLSLGPRGLTAAQVWQLRQEAARDQIRLSTALARHASRSTDDAVDPLRAPAFLFVGLGGGVPGLAARAMSAGDFERLVSQLEVATGLVELALHDSESAAAVGQLAGVLADASGTLPTNEASATSLARWVELLQQAVRRAGPEPEPAPLLVEPAVTVTSVQHAKGFSWRWAFVPGMVEGVIPGARQERGILGPAETQRLIDLVPELDEVMGAPGHGAELELRLLLVALSRGWERTVLASSRRVSGQEAKRSPLLGSLVEAGVVEGAAPEAFPVTVADLWAGLAAEASLGHPAPELEIPADVVAMGHLISEWMVPWDPTGGGPVAATTALSASSLNAWLGCPRLYHYSELGLRQRDTVAMVLGIMAHRLLDTLHRQGLDATGPAHEFTARANRLVREQLMPEVRERLVDPLASLYVELWLARLIGRWAGAVVAGGEMGRPLASEVAFIVERSGHSLKGKVDALWRRQDGTLEVVDYKTSESDPPSAPELRRQLFGDPAKGEGPSNWQLPVYVLAARAGALAPSTGTELPGSARNWYLSAEAGGQLGFPAKGFRLGRDGDRPPRNELLVTWEEIDRIEAEITRQAAIILEGRRPAAPRHDHFTCRGFGGCALGFCCDGEGSVGSSHQLPVPQP